VQGRQILGRLIEDELDFLDVFDELCIVPGDLFVIRALVVVGGDYLLAGD
jgi:hypothetical protein